MIVCHVSRDGCFNLHKCQVFLFLVLDGHLLDHSVPQWLLNNVQKSGDHISEHCNQTNTEGRIMIRVCNSLVSQESRCPN